MLRLNILFIRNDAAGRQLSDPRLTPNLSIKNLLGIPSVDV